MVFKKTFLSVLTLLIIFVLSMTAFADSTLEKVQSEGVLVAGVKFDSPPFGFVDESGQVVGFDIDVAKYIADELGVELELKQVTSKTRIPMLQEGTVDLLVATMTHNKTREEAIDYSITYFFTGQKLLVKSNSNIKGTDDLAGKTIATVQGSTSEINIKNAQPAAEVLTFQEYPQAFMAVKQGRADAMTTDASILAGFAGQNPGFEIVGPNISDEPYGIGVCENDSDFRDAVNFSIMKMWESGDYELTYAKWFGPNTKYPLPLSGKVEVWP
ncbi:transporter substrate-binding domain-containing protein [Iocasia frigidifontis]|uniref:Transporter substrate-binding domain-containing protein n=1 Tax=Iocasia fonsfrigidae TaxID=2682810 RepID=A0A8A7KG16_9FIRM|nr:ABC transporter substrate-binding protein [Iocasia fonsfrigidae]QTL97104.1 transporter substrate-binding domain-containing protein [Iocasia fonsfrigidae]